MVKKKSNPAFPRRDRKICWICEKRPADTQEHAFKSSRIKKIWEAGGRQPLGTIGSDGRFYKMSGPNHGIFMFGKTICSYCNNQFSQPFDMAYDHFMDFILDDLEYFKHRREFNWDEIFADTPFDQRHLARYYVKHFGCKMYDTGYEVPEDLRCYLHDIDMVQTFNLLLYKDYEHVRGLDPTRPEDWFAPYSNACQILDLQMHEIGFGACLQDGFIGATFHWIENPSRRTETFCFGFQPVAYMRDVSELPYQNLWEGLPRRNEVFEIEDDTKRVIEQAAKFAEDVQEFEADKDSGKFSAEEMVVRSVELSVRQKVIQADAQRVLGHQQKLFDQLGFDLEANSTRKRKNPPSS